MEDIKPLDSVLTYSFLDETTFLEVSDDGTIYTFKNWNGNLHNLHVSDNVKKVLLNNSDLLFDLERETLKLHLLGDTIIAINNDRTGKSYME